MQHEQQTPPPIVPREKLDFGLDGDIPKYWLDNDPFKTRFFDALSTLFPVGEKFFITCVRDFKDRINDLIGIVNKAISLVVVATIVITPLVTFMAMNRLGLSANLMSLGGLAIAIGLMVDGTVVVVENVFHKLGQAGASRESRLRLILEATSEIAKPTVYGISIIILVFLPLMMLSGMEGKMFGPLALTIAIALAVSLAVSLFLSPVLCSYILRGGNDHDTRPIAFLKRQYLRLLGVALAAEKKTIIVAVALLLGSMALFPLLGKSFIPTMKEGSIVPQIVRVPSISLEESLQVETEAMKIVSQVPGVRSVISKLGRGESPADPAGPNESDPIAVIDREAGRSQTEIEEDIRKALGAGYLHRPLVYVVQGWLWELLGFHEWIGRLWVLLFLFVLLFPFYWMGTTSFKPDAELRPWLEGRYVASLDLVPDGADRPTFKAVLARVQQAGVL